MGRFSDKNIDRWYAELDRFAGVSFMEDGRHQPPMPQMPTARLPAKSKQKGVTADAEET